MAEWFSGESRGGKTRAGENTAAAPNAKTPPPRVVAQVALPVPDDKLFSYLIPPALLPAAKPGCRVRAAAGKRQLVGVITETGAAENFPVPPGITLREISALLDENPALPATLLQALLEEARALLCPPGIALQSALPPGATPRALPGFARTKKGARALAQKAARGAAARALAALQRPRSTAALRRALGADFAVLQKLRRDALVQTAQVERGPSVAPRTQHALRLAPDCNLQAARAALARAPKQAALLARLAAAKAPLPLAELRAADENALAHARALCKRGFALTEQVPAKEEEEALQPAAPSALSAAAKPVLTEEQGRAAAAIGAAVGAREARVFLLHGVTGSGKTEVYLRAVEAALAAGRQAIVLVPEITLTHQIVRLLHARFGPEKLAVLHSGLAPAQRAAQWESLRRGKTPIAVGARSALFAPLANPGLIVVDEEHDGAYKSEEGFRTHARQFALRRAEAAGCPLVLGSATPSLEARFAAARGRAVHLRLARRIASRPLPAVTVVDLTRERAQLPRARHLVLSAALSRALSQTLRDGAQAILFLNRRGFSTQIACFACQHVARCRHCDIALTYHAAAERLRCHYCGYEIRPPANCPACGAKESALLGAGTERLEEEVRAAFPQARVARLDRDTARKRGAAEAVLQGLHSGALDVLIGTQMVAKGHDFPGVRLVGIVHADLGLHVPDFRASERTFQLLTQVAGRAGRAESPGRVLLQSYAPQHYAIRPVQTHDYEAFYAEEIRYREALGYPPFGRLGLVRLSCTEEAAAAAAAERIAVAARAAAREFGGEVLGPAPAPLARLRGRYRFQLLLRHREQRGVWRLLRAARETKLPAEIRAGFDPNPYNML